MRIFLRISDITEFENKNENVLRLDINIYNRLGP